MNGETVVRRAADASYETVAGEAIIIHRTSGVYYSLDEIGTQFWELVDGERSLGEAAREIADRYEVDVAMVTADLIELSQELASERLIEVE